jgi:hypothetical protein
MKRQRNQNGPRVVVLREIAAEIAATIEEKLGYRAEVVDDADSDE